MYALQKRQEDWFLARIAILPEFQNQGIGTAILQKIIGAAPTHKPLRLQVFKINPARRLYERLGFVKTGATRTHLCMERAASSQPPP
jgi:ribosomal protein S18 acetylase RimI-like enzyme